ncbi:hypothetical protein [uncultured Hyphomicrobium sp.]|uniref:hypothetical protein n=1 Tax=uncultured Hyphomicrobium sp. TaxID=194373 RepID=UPI0025E4F61E|nr:hypothetical protein [uncultured Hyphomicrobium sp.]
MMPRRFALLRTPTARAGTTGLALLTLLGIGIATTNTEAVVAGRFAAALEAAPRQTVADLGSDRALVSGSEAYWLDKRRHEAGNGAALEPAAWSAAPVSAGMVTVGDHVTISNAKGKRVLEVVAISDIDPVSDAARTNRADAPRRIAITCRDLSTPDGHLVTFEGPAEMALGTAKSARAL